MKLANNLKSLNYLIKEVNDKLCDLDLYDDCNKDYHFELTDRGNNYILDFLRDLADRTEQMIKWEESEIDFDDRDYLSDYARHLTDSIN